MKQITLFFVVKVLRRKSVAYILKTLQGDVNGILNGEYTLRERILKNISVCEIHYSKHQLMKNIYKIITSLFLSKSLEAYHKSGIQSK